MNNSDLTRFVRWGIPGWVAILAFFIFLIADSIADAGDAQFLLGISERIVGTADKTSAVMVTLVLAAVGLPLGFLIYQLYFFIRWNSPFSRDGLMPPLIVGRKDDLKRIMRDLKAEQLAFAQPWREHIVNHPAFDEDHSFSWHYVEDLIGEAIQKLDMRYNGDKINDRYRYLLDIMHTLGASVIAAYLGFGGFLIVKGYLNPNNALVTYVLFAGFVLGIFLLALEAEDRAKSKRQLPERFGEKNSTPSTVISFSIPLASHKSMQVAFNHPGFIFFFFFVYIMVLVNPLFLAQWMPEWLDMGFRVLAISLVAIGWIHTTSARAEKRGIWLATCVGVGISIVLHELRRAWGFPIDWGFLLPLFIFLLMNLTLLKNRQNARDDLSALAYYTLRRFFQEEKEKPFHGFEIKG